LICGALAQLQRPHLSSEILLEALNAQRGMSAPLVTICHRLSNMISVISGGPEVKIIEKGAK